jgi:hypothetical protein
LLRWLTAALAPWEALLGRCLVIASADVPTPMPGEDVVLGLDLARARGVAVRGLSESFVGPRSLPMMMTHSRVIYLLGGIAARPPFFGSSSSARLLARRRVLLELLFWCEGGLLAWTLHGSLRCNRRQGSFILDCAAVSTSHFCVVFCCVFSVRFARVCCNY